MCVHSWIFSYPQNVKWVELLEYSLSYTHSHTRSVQHVTHCYPWRPAADRRRFSSPRPPQPRRKPSTADPPTAGCGSTAWWGPGRWSGTPARPERGTWVGMKPWALEKRVMDTIIRVHTGSQVGFRSNKDRWKQKSLTQNGSHLSPYACVTLLKSFKCLRSCTLGSTWTRLC